MTEKPEKRIDESASEYISEAETHRVVAALLGRDRWRAALKLAEADGFPGIDALFGGRSRSKIREWLDSHNKVKNHAAVATVEDGRENFDAAPGKKARVQDRPPQPPILDREASVPRSDGVRRHLHSVAGGAAPGGGGSRS